jgi:hypothetical protein
MLSGMSAIEKFGYTGLGVGIPVVAYFAALIIHGTAPSSYRIDSQWSAFAGLFILALGIERALEPFSAKLGPDTKKLETARDEKVVATKSGTTTEAEKTAVVQAQSTVVNGRRDTAIVIWGMATAAGFLLCAALSLTLLQAIRADGSGEPPFWADLLVTGLVIGAGTKPLHDLVSNLEKSKDEKKDPVEVGGKVELLK